MTTEKEYRMAKRLLYVSIATLILSIGLLCKIGYDYFTGNAGIHNVASVILNIALFTMILIRNRMKVKDYEHNNKG